MRLERRTSKGSLSGRIMRLVPVFTLETHNRTNYKCLPKFVQTDNASSSIKTANGFIFPHFYQKYRPFIHNTIWASLGLLLEQSRCLHSAGTIRYRHGSKNWPAIGWTRAQNAWSGRDENIQPGQGFVEKEEKEPIWIREQLFLAGPSEYLCKTRFLWCHFVILSILCMNKIGKNTSPGCFHWYILPFKQWFAEIVCIKI